MNRETQIEILETALERHLGTARYNQVPRAIMLDIFEFVLTRDDNRKLLQQIHGNRA